MKRVCKWIAGAVICIGFMALLGTAGESDIGAIDGSEIITRGICCLGAIVTGMVTIHIIEKKENA